MLNRNFRDFLRLLIEHNVEFLVVGGYAVGMHGFPRYTGDMDVFIAINPDNAKRVKRVFEAFGFGDLEISEADFQDPDTIIEVGREPNKIQVLTGIDGVTFEVAFKNRVTFDVQGLPVPFIGIEDLIENKKATARSKDLIDAEELSRIRQTDQ